MQRQTFLIVAIALTAALPRPVDVPAQQSRTPENAEPDDAAKAPDQAGSGDASKAEEAVDTGRSAQPHVARPHSQSSAKEIIEAFEKDRPVNRPVRARGHQGEAVRGSTQQSKSLMRDGEYVNNVRGRLMRDGAWWSFVFESDTPESPHPPLRLLPNQQLARIVVESEASAEQPVFVLSGEVTLFESRNYLLIRKALRSRTTQNLEK